MTSGPRVRAGRSPAAGSEPATESAPARESQPGPLRVGVTGTGEMPRALCAALGRVGLEPVRFADAPLADLSAVVHLGWSGDRDEPADERRARVLGATQGLLDAVVAGRLRRLVVLTSTAVYGATADNPVPLPEDTPLRPAVVTEGPSGDLRAVEDLVAGTRAAHPEADVVVLRPAGLLGCGDGGILAAHLASRRLLVVRGSSPRWQACHIDDLAAAIAVVLAAPAGAVTAPAVVGCDGWIDQAELEQASGLSRLELPAAVVEATASRLRRTRRAAAADELPFLTHSWAVDAAQLRALGWRPEHTNASAVRAHVAGRQGSAQLPDREGAEREGFDPASADHEGTDPARRAGATFAGATAAALGTAALVRRARRRRGR